MTKQYPLEIEVLNEFEGGFLGYYSKGHHDAQAFVDAIIKNYNDNMDAPRVRHEYRRCVPVGPGYDGVLMVNAKPERGAFPVTVVE